MAISPSAALAFLSGAALMPTNPPASNSALMPTDPVGTTAGLSPTDPRGKNSALMPSNPPRSSGANMPSNPPYDPKPLGWDGIDPPWVYADLATLMSQALRKSRAKIIRPSDARLKNNEVAQAAARGKNLRGSALWRWAPEFRVKTVACDLSSRFQVQGRTLWFINPGLAGAKLSLTATKVFEVPGALDAKDFSKQIDKVMRAAIEREDRLPEILSQSADIWPFFESLTGVQLDQVPRVAELLAVGNDWALHLLMSLKHQVAARRPYQESTLVMPVISTPGHGSMPSGHATMAAFTSELLHIMLYRDAAVPARSDHLDRLARRIAFNRVVAGVHFPADSQVGYALGTQLARLMSALAGHPADRPAPLLADAVGQPPFELDELTTDSASARPVPIRGTYRVSEVPTLKELWLRAAGDLVEVRV